MTSRKTAIRNRKIIKHLDLFFYSTAEIEISVALHFFIPCLFCRYIHRQILISTNPLMIPPYLSLLSLKISYVFKNYC